MIGRGRGIVRAASIAAALALLVPGSAEAIVEGGPSGLSAHVVRVLSNGICSGVAIGRQAVVTAGHCAHGAVLVVDGHRIRAAQVTRSAVIDGSRVSVAGDAAILILREPLPASISPLPVGTVSTEGAYTIAGFGTANEAQRMAVGTLREARVVQGPGRFQLVDPNRAGKISASACYGDSGGAVMQNGMLVGVITRANYPGVRIACGFYTHYAPIVASGPAAPTTLAATTPAPTMAPVTTAPVFTTVSDPQPRTRRSRRSRIHPTPVEAFPFTLISSDKQELKKAKKWKRKKIRRRRG